MSAAIWCLTRDDYELCIIIHELQIPSIYLVQCALLRTQNNNNNIHQNPKLTHNSGNSICHCLFNGAFHGPHAGITWNLIKYCVLIHSYFTLLGVTSWALLNIEHMTDVIWWWAIWHVHWLAGVIMRYLGWGGATIANIKLHTFYLIGEALSMPS